MSVGSSGLISGAAVTTVPRHVGALLAALLSWLRPRANNGDGAAVDATELPRSPGVAWGEGTRHSNGGGRFRAVGVAQPYPGAVGVLVNGHRLDHLLHDQDAAAAVAAVGVGLPPSAAVSHFDVEMPRFGPEAHRDLVAGTGIGVRAPARSR